MSGSSESLAICPMGKPHDGQNLCAGSQVKPHCGHGRMAAAGYHARRKGGGRGPLGYPAATQGERAAGAGPIPAFLARSARALYAAFVARLRIGELLVSAKVISSEQLDRALATERTEGQRIGDLLVQLGFVTEAQLTQTLSQQLSVPWVSLYHIDFSRQLLNLVPQQVAEASCLVPIFVRRVKGQGDTLYVAMDDPTNEAALAEVSQHAGLPVKPMIASPSDIRSAIRVYYGVGAEAPASPAAQAPAGTAASSPAAPPTLRQKPPLPSRAKSGSKSDPQIATGEGEAKAAAKSPSADSPDAAPEIESREVTIPLPRRGGMPMVALTMLDGTTIQLPARRKKKKPEGEEAAPESSPGPREAMTARDLVRALRAAGQGADIRATLGEDVRWEPVVAAIIAVLLKKGAIADWELIEEFRR